MVGPKLGRAGRFPGAAPLGDAGDPVVPQADHALRREDHDQDRDRADDQRVMLPMRRHDLADDDEQASSRRSGPNRVPAPPTMAQTTASPDTW